MLYVFIEKPEVWKPVTYPTVKQGMYYISNHGRLYGSRYNKILKPTKKISHITDGFIREYYGTSLACSDIINKDRKLSDVLIHRLVAHEFVHNPDPNKFNFIHHLNNDSLYNYYENLEWCDNQFNQIEARNDGLLHPKKGDEHPNTIYKSYMIEDICKLIYIDKLDNHTIKKYIINKYYDKTFDNIKLSSLLSHLRKGDRHTEIVNKYKVRFND